MITIGFLKESNNLNTYITITKNRNKYVIGQKSESFDILNYSVLFNRYILYDFSDLNNFFINKIGDVDFEIITLNKANSPFLYYLMYNKYNTDYDFFVVRLIYPFYSDKIKSEDDKNYYALELISNFDDRSYYTKHKIYTVNKNEYPINNWRFFIKNIVNDIRNMVKELCEKSIIAFEYHNQRLNYYDLEYEEMSMTEIGFHLLSYFRLFHIRSSIIVNIYNLLFIKQELDYFNFTAIEYRSIPHAAKRFVLILEKDSKYMSVFLYMNKKSLRYIENKNKVKIYYYNQEPVSIGDIHEKTDYYCIIMLVDENGYRILKSYKKFLEVSYDTYIKDRSAPLDWNGDRTRHMLIAPVRHSNGQLYDYFIYNKNNFDIYILRFYPVCYTDRKKLYFMDKRYVEVRVWDKDDKRFFYISFYTELYSDFISIKENIKLGDDITIYSINTKNLWLAFFIYIIKNNRKKEKYYTLCDENDCEHYLRKIDKIYDDILPETHGIFEIDLTRAQFYWNVFIDKFSKNGIIILLKTLGKEITGETIGIIGKERDILDIMAKIKEYNKVCISYKEYNTVDRNSYGDNYKNNISDVFGYITYNNSIKATIYASAKLCK